MRIGSKVVLTALVGLVGLSVFGSPVLAQDSAARDAAIHKCILAAQAQFPGTSESGDTMRNRTSAYKACMTAAGQRP
jgi:hypothetical protein